MISLAKCLSCLFGKRGELRDEYILSAPKFSSLRKILKYLSSRVLLLKFRLKSYSDLFRVSMDPRVKPEGDGRECVYEDDGLNNVNSKIPGRLLAQSKDDSKKIEAKTRDDNKK